MLKEAAHVIYNERQKASNLAHIADHLNTKTRDLEDELRGHRVQSNFLSTENEGLLSRIRHLENDNALLRRNLEQREEELKVNKKIKKAIKNERRSVRPL